MKQKLNLLITLFAGMQANDNVSEEIGSKAKSKKFVVYKTNNSKLFWQTP